MKIYYTIDAINQGPQPNPTPTPGDMKFTIYKFNLFTPLSKFILEIKKLQIFVFILTYIFLLQKR